MKTAGKRPVEWWPERYFWSNMTNPKHPPDGWRYRPAASPRADDRDLALARLDHFFSSSFRTRTIPAAARLRGSRGFAQPGPASQILTHGILT